jgi:formylglycine-generating enzyme required for sulfatase activity
MRTRYLIVISMVTMIASCLPSKPVSEKKISESDGMIQIFIPAGEFQMGSSSNDPNASADEKPAHRVFLDSFWIDSTEITNAMYNKCVAGGKCTPPARSKFYSMPGYKNHPVIGVSWLQAQAYCQWVDRRLLTEAEWEKAARGADERIYPWGNEAPTSDLANFGHQVNTTVEVGTYPKGASSYGVLDMAGNAWEWVADGYQSDFYAHSQKENPLSNSPVNRRVLRGGNWDSDAEGIRVTNRFWAFPGRNDTDGFRCAESDQK